jgi:putative flippase GtrA
MAERALRQFARYALLGLAINAGGYLVYLAVTALGAEPKAVMSALYASGVLLGFVGNRQWAFAHAGRMLPSLARFLAAHALGYLLNLALLVVFVDRLGYPHQAVQAVAIGVVACFLFALLRLFVFRSRAPAPEAE